MKHTAETLLLALDGREPKWPVVQQAKPTVIRSSKAPAKKTSSVWKTAVVLPDPQIGFRRFDDGTLDPFHDVGAISVALQVLAAEQANNGVDIVVNLGDFLDLAPQGRFAQEPTFHATTQPAIDYGHEFLARQRATAPGAEIVLIEGNHDARMARFVALNAAAAFGLRQANLPTSWPVMSLPYLLRLDELNVQYTDAWPAGEVWINRRLKAVHGHKVRSSGSTATMLVKDNPHISTIFGHCHRIETHYNTVGSYDGPIRSVAASPGCLCRIDGAVPSFGSATHIDGRPAKHWENWQQGLMVVRYHEDGRFALEPVHIMDGWAMHQNQEFKADYRTQPGTAGLSAA